MGRVACCVFRGAWVGFCYGGAGGAPVVSERVGRGDFVAWMMVADGTLGTANAFLAWDTPVAAGDAWRWEGEVASGGLRSEVSEGFLNLRIWVLNPLKVVPERLNRSTN